MPLLSLSAVPAEAPMSDEVLTIKEVAALLKLTEKQTELDQWIDAQPRSGDGGRDDD